MRKLLFLIFSLFSNNTDTFAQDSLSASKWGYLNNYGISVYAVNFIGYANPFYPSWGGNEVNVDLVSYKSRRNEFAISAGMFFVNRKSKNKTSPGMQYFYFPVNLNYKLYSKNRRFYGKFIIGIPLFLNEDSRYISFDNFWLNYDEAIEKSPYMGRKKIYGMNQLRFGVQPTKHLSFNFGEIMYLYSNASSKIDMHMQFAFGLEYKL